MEDLRNWRLERGALIFPTVVATTPPRVVAVRGMMLVVVVQPLAKAVTNNMVLTIVEEAVSNWGICPFVGSRWIEASLSRREGSARRPKAGSRSREAELLAC